MAHHNRLKLAESQKYKNRRFLLKLGVLLRGHAIPENHGKNKGDRSLDWEDEGSIRNYLAGGFLVLRITMCSTFRLSML